MAWGSWEMEKEVDWWERASLVDCWSGDLDLGHDEAQWQVERVVEWGIQVVVDGVAQGGGRLQLSPTKGRGQPARGCCNGGGAQSVEAVKMDRAKRRCTTCSMAMRAEEGRRLRQVEGVLGHG